MPSDYTGHVKRAEWRWVVLVSLTLLLISFLPFIIIAGLNPGSGWQFMGALHHPADAAASISRIVQGAEGRWLVDFLHTPIPQEGALVEPVYALLGHLSQVTLRSPVTMFHSVRLLAGFFMYLALYQLAASIWVKVRTRREFFVLAAIGSGLGWLYALLLPGQPAVLLDLEVPQAFPFYAGLINVHFPLAIMSLSLLVAALLPVFRPGELSEPGVNNSALSAFLAGLLLSLVYPDALLPVALAFAGSMVARWIGHRKVTVREWRWGLWVLVPALPIVSYLLLTLVTNPAMQTWLLQRGRDLPAVWMLPVGLGLPLLVALPGLWRGITEFEPDGDRFMLLWLLSMLLLSYLPGLGQSMLAGLMLPVAYFATRSLEDVWLKMINRLTRRRLYIVLIPLIAASHLLVLMLPLTPILSNWPPSGAILDDEYLAAMTWLEPRTDFDDVVLASPEVSMWIPVWTEARVVYGHPAETLNAPELRSQVYTWYTLDESTDETGDTAACDDLLRILAVDYVVVGFHERDIGAATCAGELEQVLSAGAVDVYQVPPEISGS
jgi:hypothetical protein